ncbi:MULTISPECIES: hypothetical protein [unclassified Cupriavidus]|uniref:hypothetical protein n=1 Tax=Cupriavidus sp. H19C3 TaxID=3241603 RepID=UPI003BF7EBE2
MSQQERYPAASEAGVSMSASAVAAPLPFRQDEDLVSGPAGISIALLLIAAIVVLWIAGRQRPRGTWLDRIAGKRAPSAPIGAAIELMAQTPLNAGVRLHVIHWQGRRVLAAVSAAGQVTVLDRCSDKPDENGGGTAS